MVADRESLAGKVKDKFTRAAVTGAAGFIECHIVEGLVPTGIQVVAVDDLSAGKVAGERYGVALYELCGLDVTVLRCFRVYEPRQEWDDQFGGGVVSIFLGRALSGQNLLVHGDGLQERSFTSVCDVVKINLITALDPRATGQAYRCEWGIKVSIQSLAEWALTRVPKGDQLKIEYINELPVDIRRFDVSNEKIRGLGMEFTTDVWTNLGPTVDWMTTKIREEGAR